MSSSDFVTLFFLVAAVLIFFQLRSVLGRRTGHEKPPFEPASQREATPRSEDGKVITLPRRSENPGEEQFEAIDAYAKPPSDLNTGLRAIKSADVGFDLKKFLEGGRMAYEMIVMAFANGDRKALKGLLSRDVYEGFEAAIKDRESRGESVKSTFVGIDKLDIVHAELKDNQAQLTLRIICQLISATYDKSGAIIDGDTESVGEVNDLWTFARDVRDRDPNWKLIATESEQ